MKHSEVELWARDIVEAVRANQPVEDARVELKASWPVPRKAADRLAAHANAARGATILWIIGVDEKDRKLTNVNPEELSNWYKSVEGCFDGFAPRMLADVNVRIASDTFVALLFETEANAPYVVTNEKGGYPEFIVPWRESTGLRAARREDLLRILVPIRRITALIDELDFNIGIAKSTKLIEDIGALFIDEEFHRALRDGMLSTLDNDIKEKITLAYFKMGRANVLVKGVLNSSLPFEARLREKSAAWSAVKDSRVPIEEAHSALTRSSSQTIGET